MTHPQPEVGSGAEPSPRDQEFSQATQALVESSNRALRQFSGKVSSQEQELAELRGRLESVSQQLTAEREQRIAAEAQLAALAPRESPPPQPELQPGPTTTRSRPIVLAALGGGLLAGSLTLLVLQPRWWAGRPALLPQAGPQAALPVTAGAGQQGDILHLRCQQACWLRARDLRSGRTLIERTITGSLSLPLGGGLEVFTGRGDLLKVRINEGDETRFSGDSVAQRRFLPSATPQTPRAAG